MLSARTLVVDADEVDRLRSAPVVEARTYASWPSASTMPPRGAMDEETFDVILLYYHSRGRRLSCSRNCGGNG